MNTNEMLNKLIAEIERRKADAKLYDMSGGDAPIYADLLEIIHSLQQEQPEVDLEEFTEKINTFQGRYKYPEIISIKGAMGFMARLFYQYPSVARQWYDSLPKATMV